MIKEKETFLVIFKHCERSSIIINVFHTLCLFSTKRVSLLSHSLWYSSMPLSNGNNGHLEVSSSPEYGSKLLFMSSTHPNRKCQVTHISPIETDLVPLLIYQFQIDLLSDFSAVFSSIRLCVYM